MAIIEREDYFKVRLSCRADLAIIATIKDRISAKTKATFKQSCFGQFYNLDNIAFQGQLYLHLLFKQDKAMRGEKIAFHINNGEAEFGPTEFALVTGLKFGSKPVIPANSKFYKAVFGKKQTLLVRDIEDAFMSATEEEDKDKVDEEIIIKLALLWVLYGILLMKDNTTKKIDTQYIHLVDNLSDFNKYPWGRVAYEFLRKDIRSTMDGKATACRDRFKGNKRKNVITHIDVYGFAYALQIWAYEAIPCVATLYGGKKSSTTLPRMLRWSPSKFFRFEELTQNCFPILECGDETDERIKVLPNLDPTNAEKKTAYYMSLKEWEHGLKNCNVGSREKIRKRKRTGDDDLFGDKVDLRLMKKIDMKYNRMEKTLKLILANQRMIMEKLGYVTQAEEGMHSDDSEGSDKHDDDGDDLDKHEEDLLGDFEPKIGEDENNVTGVKQSENEIKKTMDKADGQDDINDGIDKICADEDEINAEADKNCVDEVKDEIVNDEGYNLALQTFSGTIDGPTINDDEFDRWYKLSSNSEIKIQLSVPNIGSADSTWFRSLRDPSGWLTNENIDALTYLTVFKVKMNPDDFEKRWTCVDLSFWVLMTGRIYNDWKKSENSRARWLWAKKEKLVVDYVTGRLPLHGMHVPWSETERIYGFGHVNKNHWILYELSLKEETIIVYDSLSGGGKRGNPRHVSKVRLLASLLPSINDQLVKPGSKVKKDTRSNKKAWDVQLSKNAPQQVDSSSCGVLCLKMLECLVSGSSLDTIDPARCDDYRKNYCMELFDMKNISHICYL